MRDGVGDILPVRVCVNVCVNSIVYPLRPKRLYYISYSWSDFLNTFQWTDYKLLMLSCNGRRLLLMMLEGEISLQSCLSLSLLGQEFLSHLKNTDEKGGGYFHPTGQLWWISYRLIHPVKGLELLLLLIPQNANLRNSNSTACGWLDSICTVLIRFK